ncbi:MAG: RagB/SusD family nutrient uptake outer membrane protein [Reichenbachiella sp.]|uniref:RagB/SusD family nutrient uptake outer membrane protein n=1 Tax=Reichenbachiella sp. TaxID=2184521 RepID=UPI00296675FE|nr:RagB/SusD family nutrient uptake outer membrane protein [Reichenbachiella sp.]MDW3212035.1 RagB/SusD family nutrient uptake outer membrane protein [Reichenbachiella sp.]
MKNTKYIYILLLTVMAMSCDVLDQEPQSSVATSEAIVDLQSAESAVNGLYDAMQDGDLYGGRGILATEMLAENSAATGFQAFWAELESGSVTPSNFHFEDYWVSAYHAINSANAIISAVPKVDGIEEEDQNRMLGTAYFFRAYTFFDLLRQHGEFFDNASEFGIPVPLEPSLEVKETPRSTVAASYQQITDDLTDAIALLENQNDRFYASKAAAQALMARVALYQGDYTTAASMASDVIGNSTYNLADDYNEVFTTEGADESIMELNFIALDDPNAWSIEMYTTPPEVAVSDGLVDFLTTSGNAERGLLFEEIDGYNRCAKYGRAREDEGTNTILFRLSEMYLIRAEALAMQTGGTPDDALPDLNAVRNRAGLTNLSSFVSDDAMVTALLNERRAEFAFEGHYWFDMVRLGRFESITGRAAFRGVNPIPQREMNITNDVMVQNPGY